MHVPASAEGRLVDNSLGLLYTPLPCIFWFHHRFTNISVETTPLYLGPITQREGITLSREQNFNHQIKCTDVFVYISPA